MTRGADVALVVTLVAVVLASLTLIGPALSARGALDAVVGQGPPEARVIVWQLRLPRVLLALVVGAALGVAGAALQALLANPLADPFLLGISGGGAAVSTAVIALAPLAWTGVVPFASMAGAWLATGLVWWLARGPLGPSPTRTILAGVAVNAAASAVILATLAAAPSPRLPAALSVTMGSFAAASGRQVAWLVPFVVVPFAVLLHHGRDLGLLVTGEESAAFLGVSVASTRRHVFLAAAALCGAAVAFAGVIGFVGLVTPHLCRLIWGHAPRRLLVRSAVVGATLTAAGDILARVATPGLELPVGVVTAVIGVPFFVALLRRSP